MPSAGYLFDFLPGQLIFGLGMSLMVAPLTSALMSSVPAETSGLASAINNAISRVGPQLAGALVFVAITTTFYSGLAARLPAQPNTPDLRARIAPLNPPERGTAEEVAAARAASHDAFRLAMLLSGGLLLLGGAVNAIGIKNDLAVAAAPPAAAAA